MTQCEFEATPENKRIWWGEGPWVDEPDEAKFEYNGLECSIKRIFAIENSGHMFGGHLCGYVCIPDNHQDWSKNVFNQQMFSYDVYGGLTYGELDNYGKWWIGFDCGHSRDIIPSMEIIRKEIDDDLKKRFDYINLEKCALFNRTYKTWDYVLEEVRSLADQVKNRLNTNEPK